MSTHWEVRCFHIDGEQSVATDLADKGSLQNPKA